MESKAKIRVAHLSGPNATIQNTPPLITSNKARVKHGLPPMCAADGSVLKHDPLRQQRLAAPVKVYVEQFSAHPLERDAADLYGPPDGYIDVDGQFHKDQRSPSDKPVYEVELKPEDGLYPLPYVALQKDGQPWEEECAVAFGADEQARQGFFPDGSRSFEDIDRMAIGVDGKASMISSQATVDFYRLLPPGGYRKGLPAALRTDIGEGDIPPETRGKEFFPYKPRHLGSSPPRPALARVTNIAQKVMSSGQYDGAIFTQGSPAVEETAYWLNLLIDTTKPICGNAAQRPQGQVSNDGPQNIVHSLDFIRSGIWADEQGRNKAGVVVLQEQQAFAAREVAKVDARPGGYNATGGHGGILGGISHSGRPVLMYVPAYKHTYLSEVNTSRLEGAVRGVRKGRHGLETFDIAVKDSSGEILPDAIPAVSIVKDGGYFADDYGDDASKELDLIYLLDYKLDSGRLCGFITEGQVPYGSMTSQARKKAIEKAIFCGMPVVQVGRGAPEGFADGTSLVLAGSNLTATKARLLLMASMMRFGALPPAADPENPSAAEKAAIEKVVANYQRVFDTH
jgi:L-asparaginase